MKYCRQIILELGRELQGPAYDLVMCVVRKILRQAKHVAHALNKWKQWCQRSPFPAAANRVKNVMTVQRLPKFEQETALPNADVTDNSNESPGTGLRILQSLRKYGAFMLAADEFRQASGHRCLESAHVSRFTEHGDRRHGRLVRDQVYRSASLGSDKWFDNSRKIRWQENLPRRCQRGEAISVPNDSAANPIAPLARFGRTDRDLLGPGRHAKLHTIGQVRRKRIGAPDFERRPDRTQPIVFVGYRHTE